MIFKYIISFSFLTALIIQFSAGSLITYIDFEIGEDISNVLSNAEEEEETKHNQQSEHDDTNAIISQNNLTSVTIESHQELPYQLVDTEPPYTPPEA